MKRKTYNRVAFIVLPLFLVVIGAVIGLLVIHFKVFNNTLDKKLITDNSLKTQLWGFMEIEDTECTYVVYGLNEEYVLAIRGESIEEIKDKVHESLPGEFYLCYFKDKDDYIAMDFTGYVEVQDYLKEIDDEYVETATQNFKQVRVYDISDYIGYEKEFSRMGVLADIICWLSLGVVTLVVLIFEILVALIIKLIVNKKLK